MTTCRMWGCRKININTTVICKIHAVKGRLPYKRDKHSFAGCRYLLNIILDQFVDCKFIIHYYTQFIQSTNWSKIIFPTTFSLKSGGV